jgi:hypothetical protein
MTPALRSYIESWLDKAGHDLRLKPVIINNGIGRLVWGVGPKGKPPVATGMDIAVFENGKIKSLYVFLDS